MELGKQAGLSYLSVTDHNCVRGVSEAQSLSGKYGIQVIAGVELDCVQAGCNFHLLGYGFLCTFEIDRLQTEKINHAVKSHRCECSDCQWFYRYMNQIPSSAKAFFVETGIDPVKCQELWAYFPNDNGFTHYSGYFYIAVKKTEASKPFNITRDWKTLDFGSWLSEEEWKKLSME